ncbi:hypothetical protein BGZ90_004868, partial [Linnemannia elongata]
SGGGVIFQYSLLDGGSGAGLRFGSRLAKNIAVTSSLFSKTSFLVIGSMASMVASGLA